MLPIRSRTPLARQLYGLTATERHEHRMSETWHRLGVTGITSAFNFPVAKRVSAPGAEKCNFVRRKKLLPFRLPEFSPV
jgi:hypothetical protein